MLRGSFDPALLLPPDGAVLTTGTWVIRVREWTDLVSRSGMPIACPSTLHSQALAAWWDERDRVVAALAAEGSPFGHHELTILVEELRGRLSPVALDDGTVALVSTAASPEYIAPGFRPAQRVTYTEHLAELALARREAGDSAFVLTEERSWSSQVDSIEVRAEIGLYEERGELLGLDEEESVLREQLDGCCAPVDIYRLLLSRPERLVDTPRFAVEAFGRTMLGLEPSEMRFQISDGFVASLYTLSYDREGGRAGTCWRAMSLVASGRAADAVGLNAHPVRRDAGGNADPITDPAGRTLMRGYLAQHSPSAHRLHWWGGPTPEFVSVNRHDDLPLTP